MDSLPVEIWTEIISQAGKKDLVMLSGTCRFFCSIARALLFRNVSFDFTSAIPLDKHLGQKLTSFQNLVAQRPELAAIVRELCMSYYGHSHPQPLLPESHWSLLLSTFSNLQALDVYHFYLDSSFCATLHSLDLPFLRSISLRQCVVDTTHQEVSMGASPLNTVSELVLESSELRGISPPFFLERLHHFSLSAGGNRRAPAQMDKFVSAYILPNIASTLTSLKTNYVSETLLRFLQVSLQLRRLEISLLNPTVLLRPSTSSLPLLEYFSGPAEYAETFITGRPVRTAHLDVGVNSSELPNVLYPLQNSTVGVEKLTLMTEEEHLRLDKIVQHLPLTLSHLVWCSQSPLMAALPVLSRLPNLHVLEYEPFRHRVMPAALMYLCFHSIPSLQEFVFHDYWGEHNKWLQRGGIGIVNI